MLIHIISDTQIENRIESYRSKHPRSKLSLTILSQTRPLQINVQNTSQAILQTQTSPRYKPQNYLKIKKATCSYTKDRNSLKRLYMLHSIHLAQTSTSIASNLPQNQTKSQNYLNHVPDIPCLSETNKKLGKIRVQQPTQPTHDSHIVKTQYPSSIPLENLDLPSKPKPRNWTKQSSDTRYSIPNPKHKT
jgi:hypothetical protein